YVSGPVVYELLAALCIADVAGVDPEQSVGESTLLSHLCTHSPWIAGALNGDVFGKGEPLRFPLGLQSEIMSRENVESLLSELQSVPPPDPRLGTEKQVAALRDTFSRITLRPGTAGLLARMFESQAGKIIPAAYGETVAGRISNLKRMLEASLADS